ncbi:MAG: AAA family ATPase [Lachnospiraceae bacterium]|nr:AAA family ATPase [Lachnospiraceae bacterium]MBQ8230446.1 AAA family ATPase [Lachnospiraceae bacterium]
MNGYYYFLNRSGSADGFKELLNGGIFVDKSRLIEETNRRISTKEKWICVSRPRRFGKTMALEMLAAYYTRGIAAEELFRGLEAEKCRTFYKHLNSHNVITINFNDYFDNNCSVKEGIARMSERLIKDLDNAYPEVIEGEKDLALCLDMVCQIKGEKFIFLIDEWDCVFRVRKGQKNEQEEFLGFLRLLFKDKSYVELVYMTGILPIKKYNTGSALNMFREFTMLEPKSLAPFFGFTEDEVKRLCQLTDAITIEELKLWYDGYHMDNVGHVYNPRSVVEAIGEGKCVDYWNRTGGFSELEEYITQNFDGLEEAVTSLIAGECIVVNVLGFSNDLDSFQDRDEVITALIHLGYLTYFDGMVKIPNKELREEFANTVKKLRWGIVSKLLNRSKELLHATWREDNQAMASVLEDVHDEMQEFKEYNNEHTLKCVIHLAYYAAMDFYILQFEESAGKGVADCIMFPRHPGIPGIIIELKYNKSAQDALSQIKERGYIKKLHTIAKEVLLVGINYDKKSKKHQCLIERVNIDN